MTAAVKTSGLTKYFYPKENIRQVLFRRSEESLKKRITAVDDVNLTINEGELFGLLGPNGAGKTTLIKILCTLILPDVGTAEVNGYPLSDERNVKASIGLVSVEERSFYWRLSGRRNLHFFATLFGLTPPQAKKRIEYLAELLDLKDFLDRRFDRYSTGMKQRLGIARGMLNEPKILFLDEPTKSLDPIAAGKLRESICELAHREGHTVVVVTHQLYEAELICDRIAIMHQGKIKVMNDIKSIRRMIKPEDRYEIEVYDISREIADSLRELTGVIDLTVKSLDATGLAIDLHIYESRRNLPTILETIVEEGGRIARITSEELSLDEIFKRFAKEQKDGAGYKRSF